MANHTIILNAGEEALYQRYLIEFGLTDEEQMVKAKDDMAEKIVIKIKDAGHDKFNALSVADKVAFLEG